MQLPCIRCGEPQANIHLHLEDGDTFTCQECENSFTLDDVRKVLAMWPKVVAWVEAMPTRAEVEAAAGAAG